MTAAFQAWIDKSGDLVVQDGVVTQPRTGVVILAGSGGGFSETGVDRSNAPFVPARMAQSATFVGGSGRNLSSTGVPPRSSGAPVPTGWWTPTVPGSWTKGIFTLTVTGPDDATITDGTDTLAILTTGGTAPLGDFDSTSYGATNYGELVAMVGQPFTVVVAGEEGGISGALPNARLTVSAGTAAAQDFTALDAQNYQGITDADWTIMVANDGTAELLYLTDVMATRAEGSASSPEGQYEATALGKSTYHLTDDEPADGEEWLANVQLIRRAPRAGTVYLQIIESGGVLTAVNGPFFATTLPTNSGETYYFPVAASDGFTVEQYHTGTLVWERPAFNLSITADDELEIVSGGVTYFTPLFRRP